MRLGKFDRSSTRPRLIKLTLNNQQQVQKCLRNASKLSSSTAFARIRISADRTPKQVEFYKKVKCELSRRQANGEANLKIKHMPKLITFENGGIGVNFLDSRLEQDLAVF
nr:unnamed protein product [Callosobruchus chinensis]